MYREFHINGFLELLLDILCQGTIADANIVSRNVIVILASRHMSIAILLSGDYVSVSIPSFLDNMLYDTTLINLFSFSEEITYLLTGH